jgi:hypothetical protein
MTSGGMLARESVPWGLRHAPQTECWIPGVVSFAVATASAAVVRNTLRKVYVVGCETKCGVGWRTVFVALLNCHDGNRHAHRRLWNGCAWSCLRPRPVVRIVRVIVRILEKCPKSARRWSEQRSETYIVGIRGLFREAAFESLEDVFIYVGLLVAVGLVEISLNVFDEAIEDIVGGSLTHAERDRRSPRHLLHQQWFSQTSAAN